MTITLSREDRIGVVTLDNPPVNALSTALRQALVDAARELDADPAVEAVLLIGKGRTFIAGADVSEFNRPPEPPHLPDVVAAIETAQKPWVAAIEGSALGGGLEIALGCACRIAGPSARLGFPEVKLGLIPGAGGTVRLPRLIGLSAAIEMVTGGSPVDAAKAATLGLIDAVIEGDFRAGAIAYVRDISRKPRPAPLSLRPVPQADPAFWQSEEAKIAARAEGEIAGREALASVRQASETDFATAMRFERNAFLTLRSSSQAAALRHVFFAERAASRIPELAGISPRAIQSAAVIGGGTMGAGIAAALRDADIPVILIERDRAAADRGLANVRAIYDGAVKRGRISPATAEARMVGFSADDDYNRVASCDLVIEAVFEDLSVKRSVFATLSAVCRPDAILATNTSYLDPREISVGISHPERFIGLHFFSPAQVMKLVEVVPTAETAEDVLAGAFALAGRLGKTPVRAGICDGFIGNRLLKVIRAQAERLLLAGASPAAIDAAMRDFGQPMGPFQAQDLGGLDIAAFQRKAARERGERPFAPVADRLVAMGRLGQKTSAGWYDYVPGDRTTRPSDTVADIIAEEAGRLYPGRPQNSFDGATIADAIILAMVNEAASILQERVALRAVDIDLVKILAMASRAGGGVRCITPRPEGSPRLSQLCSAFRKRDLPSHRATLSSRRRRTAGLLLCRKTRNGHNQLMSDRGAGSSNRSNAMLSEKLVHADHLQATIRSVCGSFDLTPAQNDVFVRGHFAARSVGHFAAAQVALASAEVTRTLKAIRADASEHVFLLIQDTGNCHVEQDGHVADLMPGDMALVDSARPSTFRYGVFGSHQISVHLPRRELDAFLAPVGDAGLVIARKDPLSVAMRAVIDKMKGDEIASVPLGQAFLALLNAYLHARSKSNAAVAAESLLSRALILIDRHRGDPGFAPRHLADHLNVSERMLQRHFQALGETPGRRLLNRRLELAHARLAVRNQCPGQDITTIALDSGFNDLSYFYRTFRRKYGCTPGTAAARD